MVCKNKSLYKRFYLWKVTESGRDLAPLGVNLTIAQMKQHIEEIAKKYKALSAIHFSMLEVIFTKIMACTIAKNL